MSKLHILWIRDIITYQFVTVQKYVTQHQLFDTLAHAASLANYNVQFLTPCGLLSFTFSYRQAFALVDTAYSDPLAEV